MQRIFREGMKLYKKAKRVMNVCYEEEKSKNLQEGVGGEGEIDR